MGLTIVGVVASACNGGDEDTALPVTSRPPASSGPVDTAATTLIVAASASKASPTNPASVPATTPSVLTTTPTPRTATTSTSTTTTSTSTTTIPGSVEALEVLAQIPVAREHQEGYDRDRFGYPDDRDGDGCDTRAEVLIRDSTTRPQIDPVGCTVVAGDWYSPYDDRTWTDPGEVQIDHVVALKEAHDSGAWAWNTVGSTSSATTCVTRAACAPSPAR